MAMKSKKSRKSKRSSQGLASMSVEALVKLRDQVAVLLSSRAAQLQSQLARLGGSGDVDSGKRPSRSRKRSTLKGRKLAPRFRSRKNPKLTWSGRGAMVGWMKKEMKGTKLKKEDFRIVK